MIKPEQNSRHFADNIFKCILSNEKFDILFQISLKFVSGDLIDKPIPLVQIEAWCQRGDKPLAEPMMTEFSDRKWII